MILSPTETIHYTNYWCKSKGIRADDLILHKQVDDVVLLVKYRDAMWSVLNKSEQAHWGAVWSWCYHHKFPLKKKHLAKLALITAQATSRQEEKQIKIIKARKKIKSSRPV